MYDNNTAGTQLAIQTPELENIAARLGKQNSEYISTLQGIQEKLHKIYNMEQPTSDKGQDKRPAAHDFTSAMYEQLDFMSQYNNRLQQVLDHIQKIIG